MQCKSTRDPASVVSFRKALFTGQAPDGGLYMPVKFPEFNRDDWHDLAAADYRELVFRVLNPWLNDEMPSADLQKILEHAYTFAPGLQQLNNHTSILELFHGPTLSFKDFGAQFMAKSMGYFMQHENRELTILVATSGDTGSAVAHAYHNVEGIRIVLLYLGTVQQHDCAEATGGVGGVNVSAEPIPDQLGNAAAVVDMGVGKD